ncbi:MAG: Asp-tRNA(Asn)/Glu-tRNA(Gln) amidotransferase subunit GatA [Litorivicinaceae bacterium]|nr:Asp-tRNA(Asn)/Glu-tRNA(Gln) amidotransferase subunit GatA [Litorivicinaceae bacterium]
MTDLTLAQLKQALGDGDLSSVEITTAFLDRIDSLNPELNAFITISHEDACKAAAEADAARSKGKAPAFAGLPMAHKDLFCTDGTRTTCGSKMLADFVAPYDAHVVSRCQQAGLISLGKLNMDEFAMGSSNENSFFGAVKNPWDLSRVPGGSSGGSAAAVAARMTPLATATDTGGSIRQPAALTGTSGLKPTYGRVSRFGMIAFASSLDQGGLIAHTAEDIALGLGLIAGHDPRDSTSADQAVPDYTATLNDSLKGKIIGLPAQFFDERLDPAMRRSMDDVLDVFRSLGATTVDVSLDHIAEAIPAYYVIAPAEASSNLSRFDGVRFGYRADNPKDLTDLYERSRGEGFGSEVKRRILIGTYALSEGYYDAYYKKAQQIRRLIKQDFEQALSQCDLLFGPTTPSTAFVIGEKTADPVAMYLEDIYTVATNMAGLPGGSFQAPLIDGLPSGYQLTGPAFGEGAILNAAHQIQTATDWHTLRPEGL